MGWGWLPECGRTAELGHVVVSHDRLGGPALGIVLERHLSQAQGDHYGRVAEVLGEEADSDKGDVGDEADSDEKGLLGPGCCLGCLDHHLGPVVDGDSGVGVESF